MEELSVWRLEDGDEVFWVVAANEDEARAGHVADMKQWGIDDYASENILSATQLPSDHVLRITDEDGRKITKRCVEWAVENGRGHLCWTCW